MDKQFKKQLYVWVYDKIKENTEKFGGDAGNRSIMHKYLQEFHSESRVCELEPRQMSILSTVSRIRNEILKKNPQFDCRVKYCSRKQRTSDEMGNRV